MPTKPNVRPSVPPPTIRVPTKVTFVDPNQLQRVEKGLAPDGGQQRQSDPRK